MDGFGGLDDNLRFHIDLSILIFHHNNSGLSWGFRDFNLLESGLVGSLLYCIIGRVWSSGKGTAGRSVKTSNEIIYRV